jgi:hypothetical protein
VELACPNRPTRANLTVCLGPASARASHQTKFLYLAGVDRSFFVSPFSSSSPPASSEPWNGALHTHTSALQVMTRNINRNGLEEAIRDQNQFHAPPNVIVSRTPPKPSSIIPLKEHKWNTKDLPWRVTADVTAAACASGLVAPLITMIDRYVRSHAKPLQ